MAIVPNISSFFSAILPRRSKTASAQNVDTVRPSDSADVIAASKAPNNNKSEVDKSCVCADISEAKDFVRTFDNSNITYNGSLTGFDYTEILRDKQSHIVDLYKLSDYFTDADPIVRGIVKHIYVPYSTCSPWILSNAKDKTCKMYDEQYKRMRLREKMEGIFLEYWKYGNVFVYYKDGNLITLPVHKCKIGNVSLNGQPIVDYDCQSILNEWREKSYSVRDNWIHDNKLEYAFKGYPEEVVKALNANKQYAQLNPDNTFVLQVPKEGWQRYGIPFIASCLPALAKKALISEYENAILGLGKRSFVHVAYGDTKKGADMLPDGNQLRGIRDVFSKAMSGFPLAVTNQLATAKVIQADLDDLFQWDKYGESNTDILSAGGVSGVLVSGVSKDGSTFASAQVSMQTAAARIEAARDEFCELMNNINRRLAEDMRGEFRYNVKDIPTFAFMPLEMSGKKALREACTTLWRDGLVSTKTMLNMNGYSLDVEKAERQKEAADGTDDIFVARGTNGVAAVSNKDSSNDNTDEEGKDKGGRPKKDDDERTSDPENAIRSKQPKPSSEDGSMPKEE